MAQVHHQAEIAVERVDLVGDLGGFLGRPDEAVLAERDAVEDLEKDRRAGGAAGELAELFERGAEHDLGGGAVGFAGVRSAQDRQAAGAPFLCLRQHGADGVQRGLPRARVEGIEVMPPGQQHRLRAEGHFLPGIARQSDRLRPHRRVADRRDLHRLEIVVLAQRPQRLHDRPFALHHFREGREVNDADAHEILRSSLHVAILESGRFTG